MHSSEPRGKEAIWECPRLQGRAEPGLEVFLG